MREEEYEFGKMTPENESEDGVVKNSKNVVVVVVVHDLLHA